jgi:hypothetical protein
MSLDKVQTRTLTPSFSDVRGYQVRRQLAIPPSFPRQIALVGELADGWELVQPLVIEFEREADYFIVGDGVFAHYGMGATRAEAVKDYIKGLLEYYQLLSVHTDEPTVHLFNHLKGYLKRTAV